MKRIFVPLLGELGDRAALTAAGKLVAKDGGYVQATVLCRNPQDMLPMVGEGFGATMLDEILTAAEKSATEREAMAKKTFDAWCSEAGATMEAAPGTSGLCASFERITGPIPGAEREEARLADVVVCARAPRDVSPDRVALMETIVMDAGRPVIVVPDSDLDSIATTVLVAWNGSAEAARAVSMSMPLLAQAKRVVVVTVNDGSVTADPKALAASLKWNGIEADGVYADMDKAGVAATLEIEAAKQSVDLILIGAYSHSRVREFVMGGVTDDVLTEGAVPMMLAR